jgi:5-methylthioadenosine/S-adenosylhomocysteine deaminase
MTHCVQVDDSELAVMAERGTSVAHCPTTALKVSYGVTQVGKMPEMVQRGHQRLDRHRRQQRVELLRPDAGDLSRGRAVQGRSHGPPDVPRREGLRDGHARRRPLDGMQDEIGSLEVGKRADLVLHDTDRPEWRPLLNVMNQLVWSADGRGVHTVVVDGAVVVEDSRMTTIDEDALWGEAQALGEAIVTRSGLPDKSKYPIL